MPAEAAGAGGEGAVQAAEKPLAAVQAAEKPVEAAAAAPEKTETAANAPVAEKQEAKSAWGGAGSAALRCDNLE